MAAVTAAAWRPLAPMPSRVDVVIAPPPLTPAIVHPLAEQFAQRSRADNTLRGYRADWKAWTLWARPRGYATMPADPRAVEEWMCEAASDHTPGTLSRRLAALRLAHELAGFPTPTDDAHLRRVLEGIRRTIGRPARRKSPLMLEELRAAVATCDLATLEGLRDRAVLTMGWAGAFRRSELVALLVDDVTWTDAGIRVMVRRSKTDKSGEGQIIGIPHARPEHDDVCPPCSLADWIGEAGISDGPIFRRLEGRGVGAVAIRDKGVAELVKKVTYRAGLTGDWSGHSLRAGFATQGARAGMDALALSKQTRHRRLDTLATYVREGELFVRNPATEAGL